MKQLRYFFCLLAWFPLGASDLGIQCHENCEQVECLSNCQQAYIYNPPLTSESDCCHLIGFIEYLYLKPDDRVQWVEDINIKDFNGVFSENSQVKQIRYDFDSGWRIGFGVNFPNRWALNLEFAHFQTSNEDNLTGAVSSINKVGNYVIPNVGLFKVPVIDFGYGNHILNTSVSVESQVAYNDLSLIFSKEFFVGPSLSLAPLVGVKYLTTYLKVQDNFLGNGRNNNGTDFAYFQDFLGKVQFTGIGLTAGLKSSWELFCNFFLNFKGSISVLTSRSKLLVLSTNSGANNNPNINFNSYYDEVAYTLDGSVALCWREKIFNRGILGVKIGWEAHSLSDQGRFQTPGDPLGRVPTNPLTLQGFVVGICYEM